MRRRRVRDLPELVRCETDLSQTEIIRRFAEATTVLEELAATNANTISRPTAKRMARIVANGKCEPAK
jgi:hypothetical protein